MELGKIFSIDNPIWKYAGRMFDAVWLTILWAVFSIPVITMGASFSALFSVAMKIIRDEEGNTLKQFIEAFKENFKKSTIVWMVTLCLVGILGMNMWFYYQMGTFFAKAFLMVLAVITYMALMILHYEFAVIARFENSIKNLTAIAFMLSVKNFGWTFLMVTITVCILVIGIFVFAPLLMAGAGAAALVDAWMLNHIFEQFIEEKQLA